MRLVELGYYSADTPILSNSVPGRYYTLNEDAGSRGMIFYRSFGSDPFGDAILKNLPRPLWGVPSWPTRRPRDSQ